MPLVSFTDDRTDTVAVARFQFVIATVAAKQFAAQSCKEKLQTFKELHFD
jgi:hypothetical protein